MVLGLVMGLNVCNLLVIDERSNKKKKLPKDAGGQGGRVVIDHRTLT